ncbi:hypothetical protein EEJ42_23880 [Streptomyces botrytidirepellens]|uniref:Uncharacterized protein n=1 Tax=Streptomyces botrytidirepellens TaxID=2486417 RepID=A0A3M8VRW1_9ACTN|nr:hypothetical protein EEJ42_23880 [Streptomyces botrytidirepellens]
MTRHKPDATRLPSTRFWQLVEPAGTGVDVRDLGNGPRPGGMRRMDAAGGWFFFLVAPRDQLIVIVRIMPPFPGI